MGFGVIELSIGLSFSLNRVSATTLAIDVATLVLAKATYHSSNKAIILVLIFPNISWSISLTAANIAASIQSRILVSLGLDPTDLEPEPLAQVIITMLKV